MKYQGKVVHFSEAKQYGIIARELAAPSGGFYIEKFFMPASRIIFVTSAGYLGKYALFEISPKIPLPHQYHTVRNVELFDTLDQLKFYQTATEQVVS